VVYDFDNDMFIVPANRGVGSNPASGDQKKKAVAFSRRKEGVTAIFHSHAVSNWT
jgi:hypothetical protein